MHASSSRDCTIHYRSNGALERHIHALGGIRPRVGAAPRIHRGFIGNDYDEMEITALCNLIEVASGVRQAVLLGSVGTSITKDATEPRLYGEGLYGEE
jgi:hypothetical protein